MQNYEISAMDARGNSLVGVIVAGSEEEAASLVKKKGFFPTAVAETCKPSTPDLVSVDALRCDPAAGLSSVMKKIFAQYDEALNKVEQAYKNRDSQLAKELIEEFCRDQLKDKKNIEEYYLYLFKSKNVRLYGFIYILHEDKTWHNFLLKQIKNSLSIFENEPENHDEFNDELLETLVEFDKGKESNKTVCDSIENILISYCEHQNIEFREKCFSLLCLMASADSKSVLLELRHLKLHRDWKIRFQAYYTENLILKRKVKYGFPIDLRFRAMFNAKYSCMLKWDLKKAERAIKEFLDSENIDFS